MEKPRILTWSGVEQIIWKLGFGIIQNNKCSGSMKAWSVFRSMDMNWIYLDLNWARIAMTSSVYMKLNIDKSSRDSVMKFFTGGNWGAFRSSLLLISSPCNYVRGSCSNISGKAWEGEAAISGWWGDKLDRRWWNCGVWMFNGEITFHKNWIFF